MRGERWIARFARLLLYVTNDAVSRADRNTTEEKVVIRDREKIGVRNTRWLGFRQRCQTAPYLRVHLAALERGNVGLKRRGSYFAFVYRSLGTCLVRW
ncbi:hypothetical protein WOLCODRAFT_29781 [Wolfiporia cocos MD-104 SS10]|uniref:Uncharacterized protein n=1 Tax=Wolfiporia cocos (strain MD-104) TaxID=742152 RepID=A0A2H3JDS0_WOLCO|nr:hypothetical protein WOLCODRAFT_29781 [Wolfiporia cocos MD-104 SS10]